jgi:transketolase
MPSLKVELGKALVELGRENDDVVVISGDLGKSTGASAFEVFPERYFNLGISEQDMIGTAAGLASAGKIPIVITYAIFLVGRAWEQIRNSVARDQLNVKMLGTHGGISPYSDGASHQCFEDVAIMRCISGVTVVLPADVSELRHAARAAIETPGPFYIRLPRGEMPRIFDDDSEFQIGKARRVTDGQDVGIVAAGFLVHEAIKAEALLKKEGIRATVLDMHTIKPPDTEAIVDVARRTGAIVTVEDHNIIGGLGSTVTEILCRNHPIPVEMIGLHDRFGESGELSQLIEKYRLRALDIANAAKRAIKLKDHNDGRGPGS